MTTSTLPAPPPPSPDRLLQERQVAYVMTEAEVAWRSWWCYFNTSPRPHRTTAIRCCRNVIALVGQVGGVAVIAHRGKGTYDNFDLLWPDRSTPVSARNAAQPMQHLDCRNCGTTHPVDPLRRNRRIPRSRNLNLS